MIVAKREVRIYCEGLMWRFIFAGAFATGLAIAVGGDLHRWAMHVAGCLYSAAIAAYIVRERFARDS